MDRNNSRLPVHAESAALHILIVEHHRMLAECLRIYLEALGHAVEIATTMHGARQLLRARRFDMLLSDVCLPDGTCLFLLQESGPSLPAFIVTMSGFDLEPAVVRQFGHVRRHLLKPFEPTELDRLIEGFVSERALAKFQRAGAGW